VRRERLPMKTRLDAELVRRELARSREQAADLIESRSVLVNGIPATKPATQVDAETSIVLAGNVMILSPAEDIN
jgi:23S rRNA (cytidine1920-2'-O)/16S rRNA (cytidine1409-2'-O)-methyltransferase